MLSTSMPRKVSSSSDLTMRYCGSFSNCSPANTNIGLLPSWILALAPPKAVIPVKASTPNSTMSYRWPSKMRPSTRLFGRFFVCEPNANSAALDFWQKNSKLLSPPTSNGRMFSCLRDSFTLRLPYFFMRCRSVRTSLSTGPSLVLCATSRRFGSSTSFGARASRMRFPLRVLALISVVAASPIVLNNNTSRPRRLLAAACCAKPRCRLLAAATGV
mmetsp:Transcript_1688/g.4303  ORF Transcript_1688/g.4303 Transcript_1688/m.4303 type:complete len:216 (-) Transcript_1688:88-735(-)